MLASWSPGIGLLKQRIQDNVSGYKVIDAMENVVIGGNVEAEQLPCCLIGDSGSLLDLSTAKNQRHVKSGEYFVMVVVENGTDAYQRSMQLLTDTVNWILYKNPDANPQPLQAEWLPAGCSYPFKLSVKQPPAQYDMTRVVRIVMFTFKERNEVP